MRLNCRLFVQLDNKNGKVTMSAEKYFNAYVFFLNKLSELRTEEQYYFGSKELIKMEIDNVQENLKAIINLVFKEGITYDSTNNVIVGELTKKVNVLKIKEENRKKYLQLLREQIPTNEEVWSKNEFTFICGDVIIILAFDRYNAMTYLYKINPTPEFTLPQYFYRDEFDNVRGEIMEELMDIRLSDPKLH